VVETAATVAPAVPEIRPATVGRLREVTAGERQRRRDPLNREPPSAVAAVSHASRIRSARR